MWLITSFSLERPFSTFSQRQELEQLIQVHFAQRGAIVFPSLFSSGAVCILAPFRVDLSVLSHELKDGVSNNALVNACTKPANKRSILGTLIVPKPPAP